MPGDTCQVPGPVVIHLAYYRNIERKATYMDSTKGGRPDRPCRLTTDCFQPHILARGYDYYVSGRVQQIEKDGHHYFATVTGTDVYSVEVFTAEDGSVISMSCDCPYAKDGLNCKHMAAVVYALAEDHVGEAVARTASPLDELPSVLQSIGEEEALSFLREQLYENDELFEAFQNRYIAYFRYVTVDQYVKRIRQTFRGYLMHEGYVSYRESYNLYGDILDYFVEIDTLLEAGEYMIPLEMGITIFEELRDLPIDDSGGVMSSIVYGCREVFLAITRRSKDNNVNLKLFTWLCRCLKQRGPDHLEDELLPVFTGSLNEPEYIESKMEVVESRLQSALSRENEFRREREFTTWILIKADILKEAGAAEDEIDNLLSEYMHLDDVRQWSVDKLVEDGDLAGAIGLLEEGKRLNSTGERRRLEVARRYSEQLIRLYKLTGDQGAYKAELYEMLYSHASGSIYIYKEIKALYTPEEWVSQREKIISELSSSDSRWMDLKPVYAEEEMLDRLLAGVLESPSIYDLEEYEAMLRDEYSSELLGAYENLVQMEAESANRRSKYRKIASVLSHMRSFAGGAEAVNRIINKFRVKYKRRPAMQEELNRVPGTGP